jgi:hypothetical protein
MVAGTLLTVQGVISLAYQGITYSHQKNVVAETAML